MSVHCNNHGKSALILLILNALYMQPSAQVSSSKAGYVLQLELKSFSNPSNTLASGQCCDEGTSSVSMTCTEACDVVFVFCWKNYNSVSTSIAANTCKSRGSTSVYEDRDHINFLTGPFLSIVLSNPIVMRGDVWPVSEVTVLPCFRHNCGLNLLFYVCVPLACVCMCSFLPFSCCRVAYRCLYVWWTLIMGQREASLITFVFERVSHLAPSHTTRNTLASRAMLHLWLDSVSRVLRTSTSPTVQSSVCRRTVLGLGTTNVLQGLVRRCVDWDTPIQLATALSVLQQLDVVSCADFM